MKATRLSTHETTAACVSSTPLGSPVVPEVYMMVQMSCGDGGSSGMGCAAPFARNVSYGMHCTPRCCSAATPDCIAEESVPQ